MHRQTLLSPSACAFTLSLNSASKPSLQIPGATAAILMPKLHSRLQGIKHQKARETRVWIVSRLACRPPEDADCEGQSVGLSPAPTTPVAALGKVLQGAYVRPGSRDCDPDLSEGRLGDQSLGATAAEGLREG